MQFLFGASDVARLLGGGRQGREKDDNVDPDDRKCDPWWPPHCGVLVADRYQDEEDTDYYDNPESNSEDDV
jgi:hypothetical protein